MPDFETIPCPVCSSTVFTVVYRGNFPANLSREFLTKTYRSSSDQALFEQVVKCVVCDMAYLNPRLSSGLIVNSYVEGEDIAFVEQDAMRMRTFTKALKRLKRKHGLKLSPKTHVLDIGCAGGAFVRSAKKLGLNVVGIEPNTWMSNYARTTYMIDVRSGTLADHSFPDSSFDLITLWDVIEHVPNPGAELTEIYRILKPGGLLVVNYPDFGSLPARVLGRKWPFLLSVHLSYYTCQTMKKHLSAAGFKVKSMRNHWQVLELAYVLKRIIPYFPFVRFLKKGVEKIGLGLIPLTYWMGQTQVVARR